MLGQVHSMEGVEPFRRSESLDERCRSDSYPRVKALISHSDARLEQPTGRPSSRASTRY